MSSGPIFVCRALTFTAMFSIMYRINYANMSGGRSVRQNCRRQTSLAVLPLPWLVRQSDSGSRLVFKRFLIHVLRPTGDKRHKGESVFTGDFLFSLL